MVKKPKQKSLNVLYMKVAICFFGLTRNQGKIVIQLIDQNIYNPLRRQKISYDIYLHTYQLTKISDTACNEDQIKLNNDDWKLLNPTYYTLEDQNQYDNSFDWTSITKYGDRWNNNFQSLRNLIRQLNSLKQVTKLWSSREITYDAILYLRPDALYYDPIDISAILRICNEKDKSYLVTPVWAQHGGFNDRFYFASPKAALIIGNRLDFIYEYCKTHGPLHSEGLLMWSARNAALTCLFIMMHSSRIRANGLIVREKDTPIRYRRYIRKIQPGLLALPPSS